MFAHPFSFGELLLIFLIVFLMFGSKKLPELGTGIGEAIRNFQKAMKGETDEKEAKKIEEPKRP